ncbi:MAG: TetR/AcrR family transcriptional regulator [Rhizomicrobium sp.]
MPTVSPRRRRRAPQRRAEATKTRLLDAATKAFARSGFEGASTLALERAAKVERGLLVYHFRSRKGLWRAVIDRLADRVGQSMQRIFSAAGRKDDTVNAVVRALVVANAETPEFMRIMVIESRRGSALADYAIEHHIRRFVAALEGALGHAVSVHDYYILMGACSFFFLSPREAQRVWSADPTSERFLSQQTEAVAELMRTRWSARKEPIVVPLRARA